MRVLWITNNLLPDVCDFLHIPKVVKTGWLHSAANEIKNDVQLHVAALYDGGRIQCISLNEIDYILVPSNGNYLKYNKKRCRLWENVREIVRPDVVHIHGTEYPMGMEYICACGAKNVVISIQGLISECAIYYNSGISWWQAIKATSVRDILKMETLGIQAHRFAKQGVCEIEYLKQGVNFIGRTDWDRAHIKAVNPNAQYYFNNETLRKSFYEERWSIDKAERHSIFFTQATYPLKGLHRLLLALPIILHKFPDTTVRVAGFDLTKACIPSMRGILRGTTYGNIITRLIRRLHLEGHISFVGRLSEEEMRTQYIQSHVYVNASALENSSNSIGEAQLIGVPVVASFVGGTDTMVRNNETGLLFPLEDTARLAYCISRIFENDDFAQELSAREQLTAQARHNKETNRYALLRIYKTILNSTDHTCSTY